jgi:phosphatidylserine/phosphatidylglycerophosphate/cardiolipin synthase-like enzyme/uncharacterized membrane protein YdjX (TVP38/TMEM64 family)
MTERCILNPGQNCWKLAHVDHMVVFDETADYYEAVADAFERAERSIIIVGWDLHTRVELRRRDEDSRDLLELLDDCARRRPELEVRILVWQEDIIFAFEREMMQRLRFWRKAHRNIELHHDDTAPTGSSQHQKIVSIDDSIGFVGGIDMAQRRWDTAEHRLDDPRRKTPNRLSFEPFHDTHTAFDGEASRHIADLARWRWKHATGERLEPVEARHDCWPEGLQPDFEDVEVGIVRTLPRWLVDPEVREVEALFFDSIEAADELIYLENQYLSSSALTDALASRLEQPDGPEVVLVVPEEAHGLVEEATLDTLRARCVDKLRRSDTHNRLRVVYPEVGRGDDSQDVFVHAKVCVIDDRFLRIGSANLSNRSMGVDSECDLVLEGVEARTRRGIAEVRDRLLGHHLGLDASQVGAEYEHLGSLVKVVDAHVDDEKRLVPLDIEVSVSVAESWGDERVLDPETPLDARILAERLMPESAESGRRSYTGIVALLVVLVGLAALWQFTPVGEWADPRLLAEVVEPLSEYWWSGLAVIAGFVILSVFGFPASVLILTMGFIFGALWGSLFAMLGSLISSSISFVMGSALGHDRVSSIAGRRAKAIDRWVSKRGVWSVVLVRMVPVAPFGVVNLVIGSSRIPMRDFLWGTLIGMAPGIVLKGFFGDELADFLANPDLLDLVTLLAIVAVFVAAGTAVSRLIRKRRAGEVEPDSGVEQESERQALDTAAISEAKSP